MLEIILNYKTDYIFFLVCLLSYLIGSVSFAILISKLRGLDDPRAYGSNNPGATNVFRTGDKVAALLTLIGDAIKGFIVIFILKNFLIDEVSPEAGVIMVAGSMISVLLGHLFPVFFKFKGGKGVATTGGILIGLDFFLGITVFCVWLFTFCLSNISAIAALSSAFAAIFFSIIFLPLAWQTHYEILIVTTWIISLILFLRHYANIQLIFKK